MIPRRLNATLIFLSLSTALLPADAGALPRRDDSWIRVETEHFVVLGNAREAAVVGTARELERLFAAVSQTFERPDLDSPVPTTVLVFKSSSAFAPYKPRHKGRATAVGGYFLGHPYGNFFAIDASPTIDTRRVIYHEYLHYVLSGNFPPLPLWLHEGLAEYYSTFRIQENAAVVGEPVDVHLKWLRRNTRISFADLFAVDKSSEEYNEEKRKGAFYAASWGAVHYLFASDAERRRQSARFLELLRQGAAAETTLPEVFGMPYDELEAEIARYGRRTKLPEVRHAIDQLAAIASPVGLEKQPVPWHEVLFHLGRLLAHSGEERRDEAAEHFSAAIEAHPDHGPSFAGLGLLHDQRGNSHEASVYYEQALEHTPDDFFVLFLYGKSLLRPLMRGKIVLEYLSEESFDTVDRARDAFRRSLAARPDFSEALAGLGTTYLFELEPMAEELEVLEEAHRRLPSRFDVAFNLVMLTARSGERERTHTLIEETLTGFGDKRKVEDARDALLEADLRAALELDVANEFEPAIALLEEALARTRGKARRARIQSRIAELRVLLEGRKARQNRP